MIRYALFPLFLVACGSSQNGHTNTASGGASGGGASSASTAGAAGTATASGGSSGSSAAAGAGNTGPLPPDACIAAGTCPPGQWLNVTPTSVNLTGTFSCGNFGTESVVVDPNAPATLYAQFNCQGIFKSMDYGLTWSGPINTGMNGAAITDTAGGIVIAPGQPAVLYSAGIRGTGTGIWVSTNSGVDWTNYNISPSTKDRQDFYPPEVDPTDPNHLLMSGHEMDLMVESMDGAKTWTAIPIEAGMKENGGTGLVFFVNTGTPATTRKTWLWMAQQSGGTYGTWRTENGGTNWVMVDKNEHPHGLAQIYQPDTNGVVFMAGAYSGAGWGVLTSPDYGKTWTHVGSTSNLALVVGTKNNLYAMYGWAAGPGTVVDPSLESAAQPGTGTWTMGMTPATMTQGPGHVAVTSDGSHAVLLAACFNGGLWRYVEP
jgi:hypothetical protein